MAEDEIQVLPKTSCALRNNKVVACDDYFVNKNGKIVRDYTCCKTCGWNKFVAEERLKKIYAEMEALHARA